MPARYRRLYRFFVTWETVTDGRTLQFGDMYNFEEDRATAIRAHETMCRGEWVTARMSRPTVGPLTEYLVPDDDAPSTMSRETLGGTIRAGVDLYEPHGAREAAR